MFPFVAIYSVTSIIGKPLAGYVAERFGERRMLLCYLLLTIPSTLLYTLIDATWAMVMGAILMGLIANSAFGIVPMYLTRRFPAETRGLGVGIGYAMTSLSVGAPYIIAVFTARWGLPVSMTTFIIIGALVSAIIASFKTERWMPVPEAIENVGGAAHGEVMPSR